MIDSKKDKTYNQLNIRVDLKSINKIQLTTNHIKQQSMHSAKSSHIPDEIWEKNSPYYSINRKLKHILSLRIKFR